MIERLIKHAPFTLCHVRKRLSGIQKKLIKNILSINVVISILLFIQPVYALGINDGLVGWWKLDEGSGTAAVDSSGNGNTGTLTNGPTWVAGKRGNAVNFDGNDDYIETNYVMPTTNFSFGGWGKSSSTQIENRFMGNANSTAGLSGADIIWGYSNGLYVVTRQGVNVSTYDINVTVSGITSGWHHVFVTIDSVNGAKVYYDGALAGSNVLSTSITSSLTTRIGRDGNGTDRFNGVIDDIRIYNRVLSAGEIAMLANNRNQIRNAVVSNGQVK